MALRALIIGTLLLCDGSIESQWKLGIHPKFLSVCGAVIKHLRPPRLCGAKDTTSIFL